MTTPFGPQLIGETEKTLGALLRRVLEGRLTEPQWVTLRIAQSLESDDNGRGLAETVATRAHFPNAVELVTGLEADGLLADDRLTGAGQALVAQLQREIAELADPIWTGLPAADVEIADRVLNEVVARGRVALAR